MPNEEYLKKKSGEIDNWLEIIVNKIQTSNHKFLDISKELTEIENIFIDIDHSLNIHEESSLLGNEDTTGNINIYHCKGCDISEFPNDSSEAMYTQLNQHIRSYNSIKNQIEQYRKNGEKSGDFSNALAPYTYYDASSDSFSTGDISTTETSAYAIYLQLLHAENVRNTFNVLQRIQLVETIIELVSYFIGYQSATFFNKLSREGAHLLPLLPYEWLAIAGGEGLNAFLNGYFFGVFAKSLGYDLKALFKTDSPELVSLKNLDPQLSAQFKRGMNAVGKFIFVAGLSGASVVPFAAADWQVFKSIYHFVIVSAAYEGLHWSGADALRRFLIQVASPFNLLSRYCCASDAEQKKYQIAIIAQNVKDAFIRNFESGSNRLLKNKINIKPELLQQIFQLVLQTSKDSKNTERLMLLIHSLALPPEKNYAFNDGARVLTQLIGEVAIVLNLLGYLYEADKTVAQLDHQSNRSPLNIALSTGIVAPAFLGLYLLIIWRIVADIHESTLGVLIKYVCYQWQSTKTWLEFLNGMTCGVGKSLWSSVSNYFTRMDETWSRRDSFFDFLSQQGGTAKILLLVPLLLLGWGSTASALGLNREDLNGLSQSIFGDPNSLYEITVPAVLTTATLVNVYAVFPVLSAVWNRLMRMITYTDNKKAEFLLSDFAKFNIELMRKTDAAMIVRILFDMIKRINNDNVAEELISRFFVGLTVQNVFDKDFVESTGDKSESRGTSDQQEDFSITITSTASTIKHPFCRAIEKLHNKLVGYQFFQPPPTERQNYSSSSAHHNKV